MYVYLNARSIRHVACSTLLVWVTTNLSNFSLYTMSTHCSAGRYTIGNCSCVKVRMCRHVTCQKKQKQRQPKEFCYFHWHKSVAARVFLYVVILWVRQSQCSHQQHAHSSARHLIVSSTYIYVHISPQSLGHHGWLQSQWTHQEVECTSSFRPFTHSINSFCSCSALIMRRMLNFLFRRWTAYLSCFCCNSLRFVNVVKIKKGVKFLTMNLFSLVILFIFQCALWMFESLSSGLYYMLLYSVWR